MSLAALKQLVASRPKPASAEGKYLKRSELEALRRQEEEERKRKEKEQKEKEKSVAEKRAREGFDNSEDRPSKRARGNESSDGKQEGGEEAALSRLEVMRRLRQYGLPITLFGETDAQRIERLKAHEVWLSEQRDNTSGRRNVLDELMKQDVEAELERAALEALEQQRLAESSEDAEARAALERKRQEEAAAARLRDKALEDKPREAFSTREDYVLHFFKRLLKEWEFELDLRPVEVKKTAEGKLQSASQKETRLNMRPFFKQLKERSLKRDILVHVTKIVDLCRERKYRAAEEVYLLLSIGNQPWPMGVTMVGIHERAGREKIFTQNVAHVLNDETTRKYIQGIKRLMTYCQKKYPPPDE